VLLSMSRRVSPLAGFQVTIIGRFWVTTEATTRVAPAPTLGLVKAPYKSVPISFHFIKSGIAESSDEIMFILQAERLGLRKSLWFIKNWKLKCRRPLRALRTLIKSGKILWSKNQFGKCILSISVQD